MTRKLGISAIGLLLAVPFIAFAQSDLQTQVQDLLKQVSTLKQSLTAAAAAGLPDDYGTDEPQGYCPNLRTTMQRGATDKRTGGQVTELQLFLATYYDLDETQAVSGFFGKITRANVIRFQKEQGLPSLGIAGSLTRAAIARVCQGGVSSEPPVSPIHPIPEPTASPVHPIPVPTLVPQPTPRPTPQSSSIHLIAPNGGEVYEVGSGKTLTISWIANGVPAGSTVCAILTRSGWGGGFAFPPENFCAKAQNGSGSLSGALIRNSGYDLSPGSYRAHISLRPASAPCTDPSGCKDVANLADDTSDGDFTLVEPTYTPPTNPVVIGSFSVSPTAVTPGQSVTFSWSSNLTNNDGQYHGGGCGIEGLTASNRAIQVYAPSSASASYTYTPSESATYTLTCSSGGKDGSPVASRDVDVNVSGAMPTIYRFDANASTIMAGQQVTLSWSSTAGNCHVYRDDGNGVFTAIATNVGSATTYSVSPSVTTTYALHCYNPNPNSEKDGPTAIKSLTISVQG